MFTRLCHDNPLRRLHVHSKEWITPHRVRLVLSGPELEGFQTFSPDDHMTLWVPSSVPSASFPSASLPFSPDPEEGEFFEPRQYTPRFYRPSPSLGIPQLGIECALRPSLGDQGTHTPRGLVTPWISKLQKGETVHLSGPKSSLVIPDKFDWWILIADEAGIPALSRRLEEMRFEIPIITVISVASREERCPLPMRLFHSAFWIERSLDQAQDPTPVLHTLSSLIWPSFGRGFVWVATEAHVAQALKSFIHENKKHPVEHSKIKGFWSHGIPNKSEKF